MHCEKLRQEILERTLGGSGVPAGSALEKHLQACPACRAFLSRISEVDAALYAMPLEKTPAVVTRRILAQIEPTPMSEEKFLPWTVWVPVASLLLGLFWAYLFLVWQRWPVLEDTISPILVDWSTTLEQWLGSHQDVLSAITLSVAIGILITLLSIALGLYVGRKRPAIS
jgi:predicted anti-sigma-YlaC factor YlaD